VKRKIGARLAGGRRVGDYFLFGFVEPGEIVLAFGRLVSFLMSPGAFADFPGSVGPVVGGGRWPGEHNARLSVAMVA
jgi:hypothetical protein